MSGEAQDERCVRVATEIRSGAGTASPRAYEADPELWRDFSGTCMTRSGRASHPPSAGHCAS
jgi:hypothetical protein